MEPRLANRRLARDSCIQTPHRKAPESGSKPRSFVLRGTRVTPPRYQPAIQLLAPKITIQMSQLRIVI